MKMGLHYSIMDTEGVQNFDELFSHVLAGVRIGATVLNEYQYNRG